MKRTIFAIIALFSLVAGFAQLQHMVPASVQRFNDERSDYERLARNHNNDRLSFKPQYAQPRMINGVEMVDAFIDIENKSALPVLRSRGVIINCEFDEFVTAVIPVSQLDKLTQIPGVAGVEVSRVLELCTDSTLRVTHAGQVLNGPDYGLPQAYDGSGVIVGVIDAGFDYQHLAFKQADDTSKTRIVRVYDEVNTTGHPAYVYGGLLTGTVFMDEQIDTLTFDTRSAHGTHTAGIATGTHVNGYGGMAPGADIVLCSVRDMDLYIHETNVINAAKYICTYADSVGKPCVISLSISTKQGPHDGKDRMSKAIAQMTGPGHIFVISAGNTGNTNCYVHGPVTVDKPLNMLIGNSVMGLDSDKSFYYQNAWFDTWIRDNNTRVLTRFHIFDKYTQRIVWQSDLITVYKRIDSSNFSQFYGPDESFDSVGHLTALLTMSASSKYELQCYAYNLKCKEYTIDANGHIDSRYQIGVSLYAPSLKYPRQPDSCYIDSWMVSGQRSSFNGTVYVDEIDENGDTLPTQAIDNFYQPFYDYSCINTYAVHDSIISAGATIARQYYINNKGNVVGNVNGYTGGLYIISAYQYPGWGPTGEHLPTVMAPGFMVISAGSRYSYFNSAYRQDVVLRTPEGYLWGVMSGTSMAAPTVAGIIAQWLQIEPTLSPANVKDIISKTAIKDVYTTDPTWGKRYGPNGKIDAMAGAQYILSLKEDEKILGDVNDDGEVNIKDITALINYLLNDYSINTGNADFNQDSDVNIKDLTALINYLLNNM